LRTLDLDRRHIDLLNVDIESTSHIDAPQPEFKVRIREGKPELILSDAQQYRVIEDAPCLIAQDHIARTHHRYLGSVSSDHEVHKGLGIRTFDLNLTLDCDIPQGHMVNECFVLHHGSAVFGTHITAWMIHAVIDRSTPTASFHRQVPIRGFSDSSIDQHFDRRRTRLAQVDRYMTICLIDGRDIHVHGGPPTGKGEHIVADAKTHSHCCIM